MKTTKKLKLTKQAFKNYFEGKRSVWLLQDDNFLKVANEYEIIKQIDPFRYKSKTIKGYKPKLGDIPSTIMDGNEVSDLSKDYFRKVYKDFTFYDYTGRYDTSNQEWLENVKKILLEEDKVILFEAPFVYSDFTLRTDVLIKSNGIIKLFEVKAVTEPLKEHMYDVAYQHFILEKNFNLDKWHFGVMFLNHDFIYNASIPFLDQIQELFSFADYYFNSRPTRDENGVIKTASRDLLANILKLEAEQDFDLIFEDIKKIQLLDDIPKENIKGSYNIFHQHDYLPFFKLVEGITTDNSIFNFRGDSGFTLDKKTKLFYDHNYRFIEEVPDKHLIPSKVDVSSVFPKGERNTKDNPVRNVYLRENNLLRLIQKDSTIDMQEFMEKDLILNHLKQYQLPIYMFDFEAVNFAVPKVDKATPYEQVPYQYSVHVIHHLDDLDYEKGIGVSHLEYIATNRNHFYVDLFNNLVNDLTKFGFGTYVAYNKAFEQMVIKSALRPYKGLSKEVADKLKIINENMVDLMVPFHKMYYYHPKLNGSYSIKYVTKLFTNLNYQDLNELVRKGDQSSAQCKYWLKENNIESEERWKQIRFEMLEYCKYDTLSMVGIFQELSRKVKIR